MKFRPADHGKPFLWFAITFFIIIISCSNDDELLREAVLSTPSATVGEKGSETSESSEEEEEVEEVVEEDTKEEEIDEIIDEPAEKPLEMRTTTFSAVNDAHLRDGRGFDQHIVRLEENRRTSYLMFDLSKIDSIGGNVTATNLEFTIDSDDGSGTVAVFKGASNNWSEENLSTENAPDAEAPLGEIATEYNVGGTHEIELDTTGLLPEVITLVMIHENGNDLAFASKENPNGKGPKLVVTYDAPQGAEAIIFEDEAILEGEPVTEETTTEEERIDSSQEEIVTTQEEETAEEETAEEETAEEETTEEELTEEEATETTQEEEITEELQAQRETNSEADAPENMGPVAVADAAPSSGGAPLKVAFNGSSSNDDQGVKSYAWDFKDGSSSSETDPSHTFTKVGTYEVTLTVKDEQGETDTDQVTITVKEEANKAPVAVAKAIPSSGEAPLEVNFNGKESTDDNAVTSYTWDFKDGGKAATASPSHSFTKAGIYEVELKVKDENGLEDIETVIITVNESENDAPKAVATASPSSGEVPLNVQFKGSDSKDDNEIKSYFWDFKDGSSATSSNPSHSFTKAGTYEVELTVTDEEGIKASETVTIKVSETENEAPVAVISGGPFTGDAPLQVDFKAWNSKDDSGITGYFWDFKDGSTTTKKNPTHTFSDSGEYTVELSVKDAEGLTHSTTKVVKVNQRPIDNGGASGGSNSGNDGSDSGETVSNTGNGGSSSSNTGSGNTGNYPSNAVFASSFGFKSGDATAAFEAAIKSGSSYVVIDKQSSDWVIRSTKFFNLRDMTIVFEPGVVVRAKPGAFSSTNDQLFQLVNVKNVTIEGKGASFKMNKSEYNSGEGRHALAIYGGKGVTVKGLTIKDSGGDGIFITRGSSSYSEDINITGVISQNNRRQGMTITSGQDIIIRNSQFLNTSGAKPEAGVDLEPDNADERLVNINFINCKFSGNDSAGFHLSTKSVNSSSRPISIKVLDSEFSNNQVSPTNGVTKTEVYLGGGSSDNPVKGEIRFERVKFKGSKYRIIFSRKAANGFTAVFKDCQATNVATSGSSSPITLEALSTRNNLGGWRFDNFYIEYDSNVPFMEINAPNRSGSFTVRDINGSFTLKEPNDYPLKYSGGYRPDKNVNVSINYNHN